MSGWNGSGQFNLPYSWTADAAGGIPIEASRMDTQFDTVSVNGFGNTLTRDGQGFATANLPMGGFKHTGAAVATTNGDYVVYQQVTAGTLAANFASVVASGSITANTALVSNGSILVANGMTITSGGGLINSGNMKLSSGSFVQSSGNAPVSASATGVPGQIGWDSGFAYICVATDTWKRVAIAAW